MTTDLDKYSDTHSWDGQPEVPQWDDIYNADQLADELNLLADRLAAKGMYESAAHCAMARDALRELHNRRDAEEVLAHAASLGITP